MILKLDHVQRLNLHALLGGQRGDVATIRSVWALQDKIALTADEETTIGLQRCIAGGQERVVWSPEASAQPLEFEFSDIDLARLKAAVETWTSYAATVDRRWLEPLVAAVFPSGVGS